jgi:hypothetical protein
MLYASPWVAFSYLFSKTFKQIHTIWIVYIIGSYTRQAFYKFQISHSSAAKDRACVINHRLIPVADGSPYITTCFANIHIMKSDSKVKRAGAYKIIRAGLRIYVHVHKFMNQVPLHENQMQNWVAEGQRPALNALLPVLKNTITFLGDASLCVILYGNFW